MNAIPPSIYQAWPAPNYVDPPTRGPAILIVGASFLALATLTVGIRLYNRIFIRRWLGPDDGLVVIALVSSAMEI